MLIGQTAASKRASSSKFVMSASITPACTPASERRARENATIAGEESIPHGASPRSASASSMRPVPLPGSSTVMHEGPNRSSSHDTSSSRSHVNAMS